MLFTVEDSCCNSQSFSDPSVKIDLVLGLGIICKLPVEQLFLQIVLDELFDGTAGKYSPDLVG